MALLGASTLARPVWSDPMAPNDTLHTPFGTVWVVDDHIDRGKRPEIKVASSIAAPSVLLRNLVRDVDREFTVVSGRGKFRMARGFCKLKCIFFNETNGSIVEYTVVVRHY
ncbi:unnamed protein product [Prunus armeniaca]